jgi:hypothetical protein
MCELMRALGLALLFAVAGCGGGGSSNDMGTTTGGGDMAKSSTDMALLSSCGHPGDTGNSIGVGKFCKSIADCSGAGLKTNICSALGNGSTPSPSDSYFCTVYPCHPVDGGMDTAECGENADCVCGGSSGGSGCACTPTSCK